MNDGYPTRMLYMGRALDTFTNEELIKIAEEGWSLYFDSIKSAISAMETYKMLRDAAERNR